MDRVRISLLALLIASPALARVVKIGVGEQIKIVSTGTIGVHIKQVD